MKKMIIGCLTVGMMMLTGCDWNESLALTVTQASGKLAMVTWFAVDDPGTEVKTALGSVIDLIEANQQEGATYKDVLYPEVVKLIDNKFATLDDFKKQLIESGAILVLGGIDQLFSKNEKLKTDRELARKYINAFCVGVKSALEAPATDTDVENASKAYQMRIKSMSRRKVR